MLWWVVDECVWEGLFGIGCRGRRRPFLREGDEAQLLGGRAVCGGCGVLVGYSKRVEGRGGTGRKLCGRRHIDGRLPPGV